MKKFTQMFTPFTSLQLAQAQLKEARELELEALALAENYACEAARYQEQADMYRHRIKRLTDYFNNGGGKV